MKTNSEVGLIIDGNAPAKELKGFKVFKHVPCGIVRYDPSMFHLFFTEQQLQGRTTFPGEEHYQALQNIKGLVNGNFLDFVLEHPDKIPEIMKENYLGCPLYTFFFNTIYKDNYREELYVRYFRFGHNKKPEAHMEEINGEFGFPAHYPALQFNV